MRTSVRRGESSRSARCQAPADYYPLVERIEPLQLGLFSGTIDTGRGGRIHYMSTGTATPDRRATLLLHGVGGSWESWKNLLHASLLAGSPMGDLVIPDLPGFGESTPTSPDLDIDTISQLADDMMSDLGWTEYSVLGHSMGGFLALHMAGRRFSGLVGVDVISGAYLSVLDTYNRPLWTLAKQPGTAVNYLGMQALSLLGPAAGTVGLAISRVGLGRALLRGTYAYPCALDQRVVDSALGSMNARSFRMAQRNGRDYAPETAWGKATVPIRALFGAHDKLVPPSDSERLVQILPHSRVAVVEHAGHFAHSEQPFQVLDLLRSL